MARLRREALQARLNELAQQSAKPLFLLDQFKLIMTNMHGEPVMPIDDEAMGYAPD